MRNQHDDLCSLYAELGEESTGTHFSQMAKTILEKGVYRISSKYFPGILRLILTHDWRISPPRRRGTLMAARSKLSRQGLQAK